MRFKSVEGRDNKGDVVVSMCDVVWDGSLNHLINTLDAANKNITTITLVRESSGANEVDTTITDLCSSRWEMALISQSLNCVGL